LNATVNEIIASSLHLPLTMVEDKLTMAEVETWDSLQHMDLIASFEQALGIEFTFEEIVSMRSVAEIKRVLKDKGMEI